MALLNAQKNATPDGILVIDKSKEHILVINKRYIEIFEVPNEIAEDDNAPALLKHVLGSIKNRDKFIEITMSLYDHPESTNSDEIELKNGLILDRYSAPVLGDDGRDYGRIWTFRDITGQKHAEENIIRSRDQANKANQAKSEFLSRMSHELRTPMNSILGFAQLMNMGELNPKQKKAVNYILNSGKHLLNLIDEVLDISGIESGRLSLLPEPVQIKGIIEEVIDTVHPFALTRQLKIEFKNSTTNQVILFCDRKRLKQVLINLVNNAVKYNRQGGSIFVKTETLSPNDAGIATIRIIVRDTGLGIEPDDLAKLFVPFERIGAEKSNTEGTGLGLAVVKRIMDAMGGSVGVESVVGQGSAFWIDLPIYESASSPAPLLHEEKGTGVEVYRLATFSPASPKTGTILYIEDNILNAELVEAILRDHRPEIHLITSVLGGSAVKLAIDYAPDLILLDLNLPDIDGNEVLKKLLADDNTNSIPVVILTADATPQQIEKLMTSGARDYLTKPLDIHLFLQVVGDWFGVRD